MEQTWQRQSEVAGMQGGAKLHISAHLGGNQCRRGGLSSDVGREFCANEFCAEHFL